MGGRRPAKENHMKNVQLLSLFFFFACYCLVLSPAHGSDSRQSIDSTNAIPYEFISSNIKTSISLLTKSLAAARALDYSRGEAAALEKLGLAYYLGGDYDRSTECYLNAIRIFEELDSQERLAQLYGEFGYQLKRRDLPRANGYMQKGIRIARKIRNQDSLKKLYDNYGVLKEMAGDLDSAMYFYQQSLQLKYLSNDSLGLPFSLNNIAGVHAMQGAFDQALAFARKSDTYRQGETGASGRAENLALYGDIYARQGQLDSAIVKYQRCLKLSHELESNYLVHYSYEQLTALFEKKHDYLAALENYKHYVTYKDSLLDLATSARIAELEIDYETEKKDRLLAESDLKIRARTIQLSMAVGIILLLTVITVGVYRHQRQKRERVQRELALKNRLKQTEMQKQIVDEKLRISRELHDNVGSQLTFLISSLDNLGHTEKEGRVQARLERLSAFGRTTLNDLRSTIWSLKHEAATLEQLVLRINELKQQVDSDISDLRLSVENCVSKPVKLRASQVLNLYRIVQEAVQNAVKYAHATRLEIKFEEVEGGFTLEIRDNGCGFDLERTERGNGLQNMKYRCEEAGGQFQMDTSQGTRIRCRLTENTKDAVLKSSVN